MHFRVTGEWNGEPFNRVIEAENINDCYDHWMIWAQIAHAEVTNIRIEELKEHQAAWWRFLFAWRIKMTDTSLIPEKEVMNKLGVSSRQTIWNYTKRHGFPKPVRTHPKSYLREAVEGWILNGGVNQKCSWCARTIYQREAHTLCAEPLSSRVYCIRTLSRQVHDRAFAQ